MSSGQASPPCVLPLCSSGWLAAARFPANHSRSTPAPPPCLPAIGEEALTAFATGGAQDPSAPILWPEHFDIAIEAGAEADGTRATYGVSPGDEHHEEPYAYVAPWTPPSTTGPTTFWNATGFTGAARRGGADDSGELAAFFREAARLLGG
jgi:hypothetical protein